MIAMLLAGAALAGTPVDVSSQVKHARAGEVLAIAGPPVMVGGGLLLADGALNEEVAPLALGGGLATIGTAGTFAGVPMIAGGSLRARRLLLDDGIRVSPALGRTSWGLWAGSMGLSALAFSLAVADIPTSPAEKDVLAVSIPSLYVGSIVTATMQLHSIVAAAPAGAPRSDRPSAVWGIAPWADGSHCGVAFIEIR